MIPFQCASAYLENKGGYSRFGFGAPSRNHMYTIEGSLRRVMCCVFRFGGLSVDKALVLRSLAKDWTTFVDGWFLAAQHTPSLVMKLRPTQQRICQQRMAHMALLAFRCNLTPSTLVRALGKTLHGTHHVDLFEQQKTMICQILTTAHYEHLERILKVGAPHRLVEHSGLANHKAFLEAGNHGSARQKSEVLNKRANCGKRKLHTLALHMWLTAFTTNLHVSPLVVLTKNGKKSKADF